MTLSDAETVIIQNITPQLDHGRYAVKRAEGQDLVVEADIFKEGHDVVSAVLKWRKKGKSAWHETPMTPLVNDRWRGVFSVTEIGPWEYTIEAWGDTFKSWQEEIRKKFEGGLRVLRGGPGGQKSGRQKTEGLCRPPAGGRRRDNQPAGRRSPSDRSHDGLDRPLAFHRIRTRPAALGRPRACRVRLVV